MWPCRSKIELTGLELEDKDGEHHLVWAEPPKDVSCCCLCIFIITLFIDTYTKLHELDMYNLIWPGTH